MTSVVWTGEWHPLAARFPMLDERELRDLAESIKENGQLHPCVMNPDGLGLDGRNRVAACRIAGVEPQWTVNGGNPLGIIIAANVHHRHLTTGQRAMAVAVELDEKGLRLNGRWKRGAVPDAPDTSGSGSINWPKRVAEAGTILDWLPTLADAVLAGTLALDSAYQQATDKRRTEESNTQKLSGLPADLAALVEAGVRDVDDALAEVRDRATVADVDKVRDADGAPAPSFAQRAEDGSITWSEAATLAQQWRQERAESIGRDQDRIRRINSGWGAIRTVADHPDSPYVADILRGLGEADQAELKQIIAELGR